MTTLCYAQKGCLIFTTLLLCSRSCAASSFYDLTVFDIEGRPVSLQKYGGTVSLVVNVASFCGLTQKNYEELAKLQNHFGPRGFHVLAFPCNQFNNQEPSKDNDPLAFSAPLLTSHRGHATESNEEIEGFARAANATFPLFAKSTVNDAMCPHGSSLALCTSESTHCCAANNRVYTFLKEALPGKVDWNFAKFLISSSGTPLKRYAPSVTPLELVPDIESALGEALQIVT